MRAATLPFDSAGDIVAVDRRADIRVLTNVPGRYSLGSRQDSLSRRRDFACRALNMSPQAMLLAAPVSGPVGERVVCHFDRFGRIEGTIIRVLPRGGFVMSIQASEDDRAKLAVKLAWIEDHKNHDVHEARKHERIIPRDPYSTITLADGSVQTCLVIDMSASGVAVSADIVPPLGTPLAVGTVVGRVRRHFAEGFAVEFVDVQDVEQLAYRLLRR